MPWYAAARLRDALMVLPNNGKRGHRVL